MIAVTMTVTNAVFGCTYSYRLSGSPTIPQALNLLSCLSCVFKQKVHKVSIFYFLAIPTKTFLYILG